MVCFFEFLTPSTLEGCNFLNFNPFLTIFSVPNVPIEKNLSFVWTPETLEPSP
jgi:hypothetical protein